MEPPASVVEYPDLIILDEDHVGAAGDGVDPHLTLPVEPEEVIATVKSLLRIDRAEVALRENQEWYRRIIDTALEGVWAVDAAAITTWVNRQMAAMLGQSAADMIGRSLYDFMEGRTRVEAEQNFERARRGLKEQFAARFRRGDGRDLRAIVSTYPTFAKDAQFAGALVLITNATGRKLAERAKREADTLRLVAALAAAVEHEINNPLMSVIGNLELLERTGGFDAYGRARLQAARAAAAEITRKVRWFGRVTRLELADESRTLPSMLDLERSSQGLDEES
jgi:PAS domain S-box-containing protein